MTEDDVPESPPRSFADIRTRSIWQWQLMLAIATVAIGVTVAVLMPAALGDPRLLTGLAIVVLLTVVTLVLPWHKIGNTWILIVPVLDTFAIGVIDAGTEAPMAYLWAFPVAWVASYYASWVLIALLGLIGALMLGGMLLSGLRVQESVYHIILLIAIGFIGMTIYAGAHRDKSTKHLLRGQIARTSFALRRVTDQRARNRRLLDSLDIGIARVGAEGLLEVTNQAFIDLYAPDESSQASPARAVEYRSRRGEPVPWEDTTIRRAARGEIFSDELVWLFGLDGTWRALRASTRPISDGDIRNDGLLLLVREVTGGVDPRLGDDYTVHTMAHELRNPLTAVLGHVDLLLERDDLDERAHEQVEVIARSADRMEQLINEVLSHINAPSGDDTGVAFDLGNTIAASAAAFAPNAEANGITLDVHIEEAMPLCGDAFRVRQVIDNVLGNAIKYTPRGGKVRVNGSCEHGRKEAILEITDTGVGISETDLPRIFEPAFRTESARESGIPGTGLGLGISRDIIVGEGGRLDVRSELGTGTTVVISLPKALKEGRAA